MGAEEYFSPRFKEYKNSQTLRVSFEKRLHGRPINEELE
jgi:hypothetical protein